MKEELGEILKRTSELHAKMEKVRSELHNERVVGVSGGGLVKVEMTGRNDAAKVTIDESLMSDREVLQDLIAGAINDAVRRVEEISEQKIMDFTENLTAGMHKLP